MKDHKIDRTGWPAGPWDGEPDREEWRHRGMPCLIVRNGLGALCGYVGVPPGHPWHGKGYDDVDAHAHGGLTFSGPCHPDSPICHVPQAGEPDDVWWQGFDCCHLGDRTPEMEKMLALPNWPQHRGFHETYRDVGYVRACVEQLADQAVAAAQ